MTSPIDALLSRLEGVKRNGHGKFMCRCPAHGDKSPSLAVRELDDGAVLVHCFAGCDVHAVVSAVGLELSDLFPPRADGRKPERKPFNANDLLHLAAWESLIASLITRDILDGKPVDRDRLITAAGRLQHCAEVAGGRY